MSRRLVLVLVFPMLCLCVPCRADGVAAKGQAIPSADAAPPEVAPKTAAPAAPITGVVVNGSQLPGPAPAVADPRMGAWRQQWAPSPGMLPESAAAPPWRARRAPPSVARAGPAAVGASCDGFAL